MLDHFWKENAQKGTNIAEIGPVKSGVVFIMKRFRTFGPSKLASVVHRPFVDVAGVMLQLREFVIAPVSERKRTWG